MRHLLTCVLLNLILLTATIPVHGVTPCSAMSTGINAKLNGYVPFPAASPWNQNVAHAPVDPSSAAIISYIGSNIGIHPDFGSGTWAGSVIGVPYVVVDSTQPLARINLVTYAEESDPGPMPVPSYAEWQGYPVLGSGDRHVIVLDKSNCMEYDLYQGVRLTNSSWNAAAAAVWDMTMVEQRPYTWTAANAAGMPEFPGLVRYDEVAAGAINHALSFTWRHSREAFIPPASHWASSSTDYRTAPMGMRMRLKASFDISGFSPEVQVILTALKKYGMIMTDNGAPMFLSGVPDSRWNNNHLFPELKQVTASDFEVVLMSPVYTKFNYPKGPKPVISHFGASASSGPGQPVTLSWNASYGEYYSVSPMPGRIRGNSTVVYPQVTTTYTLYATNPYERTTATVTVYVP